MPAGASESKGVGRPQNAILRVACLPLVDPLAESIAFVALVPLTLVVALWNGFPIIFYDTGAYLLEGLGRVFLAERSPVYSLFLDYAGARESLWLITIIQAAALAFVVVETARVVAPKMSLAGLLGIALALVVLTGLPWYVGQIEPDSFAAVCVLSIYLLAFHQKALAGWRAWVVLGIACFSAAVHLSHLLLSLGLLLVAIVYRVSQYVLQKWRSREVRRGRGLSIRSLQAYPWPQAYLSRVALACVMGLGLILICNYELTAHFFVSRAGPAFLFARMLQDKIVMRLLDDTCPRSRYRLCAYKNVLPRTADQWLWGRDSPFLKMGRFTGTADEADRIIWDSLERYPMLEAEDALDDAARQFVEFKTGDQIEPQEWVLERPFEQFIPGQLADYLAARQQKGEMNFRPINRVHVAFAWISLVGLIGGLGLALWWGQRRNAVLLGFILAALIGNAIICGALSNPHDRYQSRLIWLAPFSLALIVGDWRRAALRTPRESGT